jgi:hypothetical protein
VRHATASGLDELEPMLRRLRRVNGLTEKARGVFYRKSRAFLHFHEDPSGFHADVRLAAEFERRRLHTEQEQDALVDEIERWLDEDST